MHDSYVGGRVRPTTVVVPANVNRALIRNKVTFRQYLDYEKIRSTLSSEDIKFWMAANEGVKIGGKPLSSYLAGAILSVGTWANIDRDPVAHVDPFYIPSKREIDEVDAYLNQSNAMTENLYSLHREGSVLFVVVEEGFSLKLEESLYRLEFLKSYMKKLCEIVPVYELAQHPLHQHYVSLVTT